jgi:hypothetical protein
MRAIRLSARLKVSRKTGPSSHHLALGFYVGALRFIVGSIGGGACEFRLIMTLTARAKLPMLARERRGHEAFGARALIAKKILHWKGNF